MEKQLAILKALAHPLRLEIIYTLSKFESRCVCELEKLDEFTTQSSLSQHLKILRDIDLVVTRKLGGWVHYSLKDDSIIDILENIKKL
ncbi:metalloregulator ArsR/SmtB family transcription factor [uncultured Cetobacterium sp.]|uniref:ArsR/SmtB family transcription factor n=1 Tax=uncultured Cetobacterium sp. TaxID=527638 RepID=UPI00260DABCD|nr:metalloregulator ArsR/SmtB family transcription factor [uncultured Cetobacterium sp.]